MTLLMMKSASSVVVSLIPAEKRWALYWLSTGEMGVGVGDREKEWMGSCGRQGGGSTFTKKCKAFGIMRWL